MYSAAGGYLFDVVIFVWDSICDLSGSDGAEIGLFLFF